MSYLDSNRQGHLTAAVFTGFGGLLYSFYADIPALTITAIAIPLWEFYATPDMDHASRKVWGSVWRRLWVLYWRPYAKMIGHRSRWSHSLLFGLPLRLSYGLAPLWLWLVVEGVGPGEIVWYGLAGCALADVVHLIKDGYGPVRIIFGR